jgi:MarR-like DNA-binding transcriptional regulator SgrR of sgrS sRNA
LLTAARRRALLAEGYARVCAAGQLLSLRHSQKGLEYVPQLGGLQLAFCGWIPFRQLWLREPTGETVNA